MNNFARNLPLSEACGGGHTILAVRWVEVKQADGSHMPRLFTKGIKMHSAPDLFAATPPIESQKYLLRRAGPGSDVQCYTHTDVTRAYSYADAVRENYQPRRVDLG